MTTYPTRQRNSVRLACCALLLHCATALPTTAAEHPTPGELRSVRETLTAELDKRVLPFWTAEEPGDHHLRQGFLMHQEPDELDDVKPLIAQLRLLYVYDIAAQRAGNLDRRAALLQRSQRQLDRLEACFWDKQNGGWYITLDQAGNSAGDDTKPTIAQIYAIYVLSSLEQSPLKDRALQRARLTFDVLDNTGWDNCYGGYFDHYRWPADHPQNHYKQTGTNFHALQAVTELYAATNDPTHRQRLESLCRLTTTYYVEPKSQEAYVLLSRDWAPLHPSDHKTARRTIYGHTVELVWYTLEGIDSLGSSPRQLNTWARSLADGIINYGLASDGFIYHYGDLGGEVLSKRADWWAQVEGMIMFLRLYEVTGEPTYWKHFETLRNWSFHHLVPDGSGTWLDRPNAQGQPMGLAEHTSPWRGGLHLTRALVKCEQILKRLETSQDGDSRS